jgi:hypothetical protein
MNTQEQNRLGIDVGRVLISPGDESSPDTSFIGGSLEDALRTPPYEGIFEILPALVEKFAARVWIVSKCGARVRERTVAWFQHHHFFERTGIDPANVRFCRERAQKAPICAELGITHFIDDRSDVLEPMSGIVANRFLFGPQRNPIACSPGLQPLADWGAVGRALL